MNIDNILVHKTRCVMGLGQSFKDHIDTIRARIGVTECTDNREIDPEQISGLHFVPPLSLRALDDPFVIVTTSFENYLAIDAQLDTLGIPHCYYASIEGLAVDFPVVRISDIADRYQDGNGNVIEIKGKNSITKHAYVFFGRGGRRFVKARHNHLEIGEATEITGESRLLFMGQGSSALIGEGNYFGGMDIALSDRSCLRTGDRCTFESLRAIVYEQGSIQIGNDCMFSHNVELWQTDSHPIFCLEDGSRINRSENIYVGDHVWVGARACLLGGAHIGNGSVVGINTTTSSRFAENVIIAGNPARVLRTGIQWSRDELCENKASGVTEC